MATTRVLDGESTPIYNRGMPRKVILGFGVSLDGYIARRNGAMDYLVIDKEGEALMADFFESRDREGAVVRDGFSTSP